MTPRIRFALIVAAGAGIGALVIGLVWDRGPLIPLAIVTGVGAAIGGWLVWPLIAARTNRK
jgi:hypothetical protein